jgi:hypothetical protein
MALVKNGYIGDSSVSSKLSGGGKISNGTVYQNVGTGGQNLRDQGYPNYYGSTGVA